MDKYRNIITINNRSLELPNISHIYRTNHIPVNLKFKTEPCCHLQFPRTVTVYSFTSNNMILFKTLPTASIKSIVLEPHSGSVVGMREGYLHCVVHYINPQWEQTLPHTFRNQSTIIVQGKLITATKYPTMAYHLSHTIWPQHTHQALLHYYHEHKLLTYPSNAKRISYIQATMTVMKRIYTIKYTKPI